MLTINAQNVTIFIDSSPDEDACQQAEIDSATSRLSALATRLKLANDKLSATTQTQER